MGLVHVTALTRPVFVAQGAFENFARATLGEGVGDDFDATWDFVASDEGAGMRDNLFFAGVRAGFQDNNGVYRLAPRGMRDANHGCLQHGGMCVEGVFDLD